MKSTPPLMYKYFGPDRTEVLKNCLVRYSPLGAFNDPFEGRPEILAITSQQHAKETFQCLLTKSVKETLNSIPKELRARIPEHQLETLIREQLEAKESEIVEDLLSYAPEMSQLLSHTFDRSLGAFCLSEVPDNLLMWSHYGASHSGFALEFDTRHEHFHQSKGPKDEFRHLRRVEYRETRPSANLTELDGVDVFLVKSEHWAYEREWRIFQALENADFVIQTEPHDIHLFRFPPETLRSVILGARATNITSSKEKNILRSNNDLKHVKLCRAKADDSHFLLHIEDDPS